MSDYLDIDELGPQNDGEPVEPKEETPAEPSEPVETETSDNEEPQAEEPKEEKPKNVPGSRIAREALQRARAELAQTQQELQQLRDQLNPKPWFDDRPTLDKFETVEEFEAAVIEYGKKLGEKEVMSQIQRQQQEQRDNEIGKKVADDIKKVSESDPEWEDKFAVFVAAANEATAANPGTSHLLGVAIQESDAPAKLIAYFGKNPDTLISLANMNSTRAILELGKIQAKLENESKPQKPVSKAPKPITPVNPVSNASIGKFRFQTYDEY